MMILNLDGATINNRDDFYRVIKQELLLPDYFGNNLDALHDFIEEEPDRLCLTIHHYVRLMQNLTGSYLNSLFRLVMDCGGEIHILS